VNRPPRLNLARLDFVSIRLLLATAPSGSDAGVQALADVLCSPPPPSQTAKTRPRK
jgi:hypothetical protein